MPQALAATQVAQPAHMLAQVNVCLMSLDQQCHHLLAHAYSQPDQPISTTTMLSTLVDMSRHTDSLNQALQMLKATIANPITYCLIALAGQAHGSIKALRQIVEQDHTLRLFDDNALNSPHVEQIELLLTHLTEYLNHIRYKLDWFKTAQTQPSL